MFANSLTKSEATLTPQFLKYLHEYGNNYILQSKR